MPATNSLLEENRDIELKNKLKAILTQKNIQETEQDKIIQKLMDLGAPFKKAIDVLGVDISGGPRSNPILAFVMHDCILQLIRVNLLNVATFKAIYNAVAKNIIPDSEFFTVNDYNIIYCPDLYRKSANDIEKYITLQKAVLFGSKEINAEKQLKNKKVFFKLARFASEPDNEKYAADINAEKNRAVVDRELGAIQLQQAKLNSLALAKEIAGAAIKSNMVDFGKAEQDKLVKEVNTLAKIFVTLLSLSINTKSKAARDAIAQYRKDKFSTLTGEQIAEASALLAQKDVLPKGSIDATTAEEVVLKICAKLAKL
jgi:predicted nucleic-acid-binding protein